MLEYDINQFKNPLFTVDSVLFTVVESELKVLMVKRANEPFAERWGLPGGFVDVDKDDNTDMTARRKLTEKTGLSPRYLEQLQVFSGINRDPRGFSVTSAYYALVAHQPVQPSIDTVEQAKWISLFGLKSLAVAFDHKYIIDIAHKRLQQKALYSMVPVYCCPEQFTVGQLKDVIETIIEKEIQRKSLMRRIDSSGMFEFVDEKVNSGGRSAQLYKTKKDVSMAHFERNFSI
ncbi:MULTISPECIES: NUDIX hydrolase [Alteromonadaceae]|uniref:NUDIX hydrolase n=1 Tax=Paraglaciecola chathamensis TaxID=368405 RepID=A0A8H9IE14_9ALTE|nr:NUDIX domain-containing protein [Paraglaciecola oceanifecundans]GGZ83656.1 NUDIX hydrolase [Paraglaciecola oceanifecundans]|tara:strand:- start:83 stop:778 length:696 start_codon:yes stop_codon:yes gene_type:complete